MSTLSIVTVVVLMKVGFGGHAPRRKSAMSPVYTIGALRKSSHVL